MGAFAQECVNRQRAPADKPEEIPNESAGAQGMAEEGEESEAAGPAGRPAAQAAGLLELLWGPGQLDYAREIPA